MIIEEAIAQMLGSIEKAELSKVEVPVSRCAGYYLDGNFYAAYNVPEYNRSAMDGYAVRSEDIEKAPVTLRVVGEMLAGDHKDISCESMTAVRIMTGAMIPEGYDCVVCQEDTCRVEESTAEESTEDSCRTAADGADLTPMAKASGETEAACGSLRYAEAGDLVCVKVSLPAGRNVGLRGEDTKKGELLIKDGTRLSPAHAGILASQGIDMVRVKGSPRISIISTGSELCYPGEELRPGCIYNSSRYILSNAIISRGLEVSGMYMERDDEVRLKALLSELSGLGPGHSDEAQGTSACGHIIITTGGVSVGKKDMLPGVLKDLGAQILFRGVDIQPGTPTIGARLGNALLLCLSGNPFAAIANFEVYFWEAAAKLMDCEALKPPVLCVPFNGTYDKKNQRRRLIRARYEGGSVTLPTASHFSSVVSDLTLCNCLLDLERGRTLKTGDEVMVRMLGTCTERFGSV